MLILWRRTGQSLTVGAEVEIEVLEARPNRVKLGIVAPAAVSIVRGESRITREENLAAALSADHRAIETLIRRLPAKSAEPQASNEEIGSQRIDGTETAKILRTSVAGSDMKH